MTKPLPYSVVLTQEERDKLTAISGTPSQQMRTVRRAYILLMLDRGLSAPEISRQLGIVRASVYNCVKRYREGGIERAIYDGARPGGPRRISDEAIQWMRSVAAMPPGLVGINAERWTVTMLQQYIERQAEAYGFPEITSISRSRLWELLTKNGGRSVTPVITKPVPAIKTIEFYWRQTFVPVLQDVDGFWQVSYNDDVSFGPYGTDSRCPDGPCLSFITGLILTTGRLFVYPGNKEKAQDMLAFLQHLDRKTEKRLHDRTALGFAGGASSRRSRKVPLPEARPLLARLQEPLRLPALDYVELRRNHLPRADAAAARQDARRTSAEDSEHHQQFRPGQIGGHHHALRLTAGLLKRQSRMSFRDAALLFAYLDPITRTRRVRRGA